jgi:hypothetical protein
MDGTNYAQVTSAIINPPGWNCTSNYGCNPAQPNAVGVVGNGPGFALWSFPVASISFNSIAGDIGKMKNNTASTTPGICTAGQTYGCYFPSWGGSPSGKGYHAVFQNDGRMNLYRVTNLKKTREMGPSGIIADEYTNIGNQVLVTGSPFTLPAACPIVFVEDNLFIDGTVKGKISIVAADLDGTNPDLVLSGNINYTTTNGNDGLLAIGENRVIIPLDSPNNMTVNGIFIAQKGYFGRNYISSIPWGTSAGSYFCGAGWDTCLKRNSMNIYGTVVSSGRVGTKWTSGGVYVQGYNFRTDYYDSKISDYPPPFTPHISDTFKFLKWSQDR